MTEPAEKPISEFQRIPEILFKNASKIRLGEEYLVSVLADNQAVEVLVTSGFNSDIEINRVENLERYKKNPKAK